MLFRFLAIATVSITYLTFQAASSTESRSERLKAKAALTTEQLNALPTVREMAHMGKRQATIAAIPPLPTSRLVAMMKFKSKQKLLKAKANAMADGKEQAAVTYTVTEKQFVRLAYMPASYHPAGPVALQPQKTRQQKLAGISPEVAIKQPKTKKVAKLKALNDQPDLLALIDNEPAYQKPKKYKSAVKPKYSLGMAPEPKKKKKHKKKKYYKKRAHRTYYTQGLNLHF